MINMDILKLLRHRWVVFLHDLVWIPIAIVVAFWARFNFSVISPIYWQGMLDLTLVALPIYVAAFWFFGCYRGIWRYASVPDLVRIIKAVVIGALVVALVTFLATRLMRIPRTVLILYPLLLALGMGGSRLVYRTIKDQFMGIVNDTQGRALIVGAGRAGEMLIRDLRFRGVYAPVVLVDDDRDKQGYELHGVRVRGTLGDLQRLIREYDINIVLIALPSASRQTMDRVVQSCNSMKVPCRTLPSLAELADGRVEVSRLRPVTVEDLLGRELVALDSDNIANFLRGKRVLVTGGGGSIGAELCRQVGRYQPALLTVMDNSECNLYHIDQELSLRRPTLIFNSVLGDVSDERTVEYLVSSIKPQIILHAAAYKHVPILENNIIEAIQNNIFGTRVIADAALRHGADQFVLISSDKTVNPASIMGTTKRVAEIYCQALNQSNCTRFLTARFGNVLASAGSVVPLFERQIATGGPVTVTHPEITRYFMTISEAANLILQAGAIGKGGEIFVLDMGEPVRIRDLADKMISLSGLRPDIDIKVVYTGLRAGEKLHEELFYDKEQLQGTVHPKLLLANSIPLSLARIVSNLNALTVAVEAFDEIRAKSLLRSLVPEFTPSIVAPADPSKVGAVLRLV